MHLLNLLTGQLQNQFVGGGLVLLLSGSILALLRATPAKLLGWCKRRITLQVEVLNSDLLFDYVTTWLDKQPYSSRSRILTATSDKSDRTTPSPSSELPRVLLTPAPGTHVFWYRRNIIWLKRHRENSAQLGASGNGRNSPKHETYTLTILGRTQRVLRELIEEIVQFGGTPAGTIRLFNSSFGYWNTGGMIRPRTLDSVILPDGVAESILADAKQFLASEDWYRNLGIPWHRGYLFHGVPGAGKTSLVSALAGELGMDLYLLNIGGPSMDDERLSSLMAEVRPRTIVLMEDVDCTFPDRNTPKGERAITLSGLLNCLDGVQSREGCMIFTTTNRRDKLDSALTRPGRVDVDLEFGHATASQIQRFRDRLEANHVASESLFDRTPKTMADVQQLLLASRNQPIPQLAA